MSPSTVLELSQNSIFALLLFAVFLKKELAFIIKSALGFSSILIVRDLSTVIVSFTLETLTITLYSPAFLNRTSFFKNVEVSGSILILQGLSHLIQE